VLGPQADLLAQLALGAFQLALALDVPRARRDLQQPVLPDRLARLADQMDALLVVGEDPDRTGVLDDLALDLAAVGAAKALAGDVDELAAKSVSESSCSIEGSIPGACDRPLGWERCAS
jgi:hypothetical protein